MNSQLLSESVIESAVDHIAVYTSQTKVTRMKRPNPIQWVQQFNTLNKFTASQAVVVMKRQGGAL
ncbi:MAG: hypothetical protein ACKVH8_25215 [Pirellulales bacterium]|jgi:hypothetical protein